MKQKVVTKAIIKEGDKLLLLRRHGGRPSIDGLYELPGGRIHGNQQPEDALSHALNIHLGLTFESSLIVDAITYIDPDDREVQYVFIIFQVTVIPASNMIRLSEEYDKWVWKKMSDIQQSEITQSTQQILGLQPVPFAPGRNPDYLDEKDGKNTTTLHMIGYSDGGSRGNPGPAASGFVLFDTTNTVLAEGGAYIGIASSEVAEYSALYLALEKALELGAVVVDMRLDSQLVVGQMNSKHTVSSELAAFHNRTMELVNRFNKVTISHINRKENVLADGVVNTLLDKHFL